MASQTATALKPANNAAPAHKKGSSYWSRYLNSYLARELSTLTRYYDQVIQWLPRPDDTGQLLEELDVNAKQILQEGDGFPTLANEEDRRTAILINGTLNHHFDIQALLTSLKSNLARTSRVLLILYNPYLRWLYQMANGIGIRKGEVPTTFLRRVDLLNLAKISGFEIVKEQRRLYCPLRLFGFGDFINRVMPLVPFLRCLSLIHISVWRPLIPAAARGLSCVIPARNERGNIENALRRFPRLDCPIEIIFVEGHSNDGTWEEILRVAKAYGTQFQIKAFQQTGKGKGDAVRLGFAQATLPLVTILDADLTMPPELLTRFYNAYNDGLGDFVNGSRLVYPMEGEAMRPLNRLGNVFFAKTLSWVLDAQLSDSLCGTKLLTRHDYQRFIHWRKDFGDFDPFGDFELLFPATIMGLGVVEIPVRYRARTYGTTNIQRFRHGLQLFNMTAIGFVRVKMAILRRQAGARS